ncbi:hemagglutinin/amebocyte aggregation factor [Elysia marginata]|uniref:Hemagglutinin/amebocyte aggregation factor n=1 Tax=Elysia marginata TaxID=1093978 RepID=A0AAV4J723_9GAST|nr:hemagglutinin/amebocyte aggregation factor [Elysia marginata]
MLALLSRYLTAHFLLAVVLFTSGAKSIWLGPIGIEAQDFAKCLGPQKTFSSISLEHAGDVWDITCRSDPLTVHLNECYWSGFQNEYSNSLNFQCSANHVITEIEKLYDQNLEDLRLNFKCCTGNGKIKSLSNLEFLGLLDNMKKKHANCNINIKKRSANTLTSLLGIQKQRIELLT